MERFIYTFKNDGTGTSIQSFYGDLEYNMPLNITSTIEEARNTEWGWTTFDFLEPDEFIWEFLDDLLKLTFLEYGFEQTIHIEIEENEFVLILRDMDVTLFKD